MSDKSGIQMNGRIENTNKVKAINCDCSLCGHSKQYKLGDQKMIYCKIYKKNNPQKHKCKRFYYRERFDNNKKMTSAKEITSWEPAFPWEIPIGGKR